MYDDVFSCSQLYTSNFISAKPLRNRAEDSADQKESEIDENFRYICIEVVFDPFS